VAGGWQEEIVGSHVMLGRLLVETGRLDEIQLLNAVAYQRQWGGRLGEALVALRIMSETEVLAGVALQRGIPYVEIGTRMVSPAIVQLLPEKFIRARKVFPLALDRSTPRALVVATNAPYDLALLDDAAFASGKRIRPVLACSRDIVAAIERHLDRRS
jgi:type IV pilus assembly protein PilB